MADLLRLLAFLRRLSRGVPRAALLMAGVIVSGVVGGLANTAMLALINAAISRSFTGPAPGMGWRFLALVVALPAFRLLSQTLLIHLSQRGLLQMRLDLSRRILAAPLRQLEGV